MKQFGGSELYQVVTAIAGDRPSDTTVELVRITVALASPLIVDAHRAVGEMFAARSPIELAAALRGFFSIARDVSVLVGRLERARLPPRLRFSLLAAIAPLRIHPLADDLRRSNAMPALCISRLARGTAPPFTTPLWGERRPVIEVCADYLELAGTLFDRARHEVARQP